MFFQLRVIPILFLLAAAPYFALATNAAEEVYRIAEASEERLQLFERVGVMLGFSALSSAEDTQLRELFNQTLSQYFSVFKEKDPLWSNRAAYRIAALTEGFYKQYVFASTSIRNLTLASPFSLDPNLKTITLTTKDLQSLHHEIELLYENLIERVKKDNSDKELLAELKEKSKQFKHSAFVMTENVNHPWAGSLLAGTIRREGNIALEYHQNTWVPLNQAKLQSSLAAALRKGLGTSMGIHALVVMAQLSEGAPLDLVKQAIRYPSSRVRLAGLVAAQLNPRIELLEILLSHWQILKNGGHINQSLFGNAQAALFGEAERTLLALHALVKAEPASLKTILNSSVLPAAEKAWLANAAPGHFNTLLSQLVNGDDAIAAARALYVLLQDSGKNNASTLKKYLNDPRPMIRLSAQRISFMKSLGER